MMKMHERKLIEQFLRAGGRVEVVKPSKRKITTFRNTSGLNGKGAKAHTLKNTGVYLR
jgi:hypothetical protein